MACPNAMLRWLLRQSQSVITSKSGWSKQAQAGSPHRSALDPVPRQLPTMHFSGSIVRHDLLTGQPQRYFSKALQWYHHLHLHAVNLPCCSSMPSMLCAGSQTLHRSQVLYSRLTCQITGARPLKQFPTMPSPLPACHVGDIQPAHLHRLLADMQPNLHKFCMPLVGSRISQQQVPPHTSHVLSPAAY